MAARWSELDISLQRAALRQTWLDRGLGEPSINTLLTNVEAGGGSEEEEESQCVTDRRIGSLTARHSLAKVNPLLTNVEASSEEDSASHTEGSAP